MPRDYKHRATARRKHHTSPWLYLIAGLMIGLLVSLIIYIKMAVLPVTETEALPTPPEAEPPQEEIREDKKSDTVQSQPPAPKPRFDFYTILPEMEVVIEEHEISGEPQQGVRQVEKPGLYLLQAGSFRSYEQADKLKAELALMGLETDIHKAPGSGQESWNRVRVGPYNNLAELNEVRALLRQNGINAILIRVQQ